VKLRNKSHSVGACWFAATCALGVFFLQERSASALGLDTGVEGGVATRSNYSWGPFYGAHLELRPFKGLRVGAYFSDTLQNATDGRKAKEYISHVSVGGRVRYLFDFNEKLHAFGAVGIGYVYSEFPAYEIPAKPIVNPTMSQQQLGRLDVRDGNFIEVPVSAGVAYSAFSHTNFSLNLAWRPGFSFKGEAYEGEGSYARPTQGFSASLGMSFFF
jgi:opacity protein-like surface antigen